MQNYFSIETEAAHRQYERERDLIAADQCALACREHRGQERRYVAPVIFTSLRALAAPWLRFLARPLRQSSIRDPWRRSCLCDVTTTSCT